MSRTVYSLFLSNLIAKQKTPSFHTSIVFSPCSSQYSSQRVFCFSICVHSRNWPWYRSLLSSSCGCVLGGGGGVWVR